MMRKEKNEYLIQSVSLACSLLEQFNTGGKGMRLAELSRRMTVSKNKLFRVMATLEGRDYIEKTGRTGAYRLGVTALKLGESWVKSRCLVREARPSLEAACSESEETAFLALLCPEGLVCADAVESRLPVKVVAEIGSYLPLYGTAAGKALLACGGGNVMNGGGDGDGMNGGGDASCGRGERSTPAAGAWLTERERIRERGYAVSMGEFESGANAVAAVIRDHSRAPVGAVCIAAPSFRLDPGRIADEVGIRVLAAAREISRRMGYRDVP